MKNHTLVINIEDDCLANYTIVCPHEGPDRPCASYQEKDWPDEIACRCAEIGDGAQCEWCADGDHDACAWGTHINDVGPSCRAEPMDECWYAYVVKEGDQGALDFGRNKFELRVPVILRGGSWEEPIEIEMVKEGE